jgi:hypothetical protein
MSLTTDGLALGAAAAIAFGSAVQARQAYTELDATIPARTSVLALTRLAIKFGFSLLRLAANPASMNFILVSVGLLRQIPTQLTTEQIAALSPAQAAVLAVGAATALTTDQEKALAKGDPVRLTSGQVSAMMVARVKDTEKWLAFLLGWLCILIGALAALAGAALTLANDL